MRRAECVLIGKMILKYLSHAFNALSIQRHSEKSICHITHQLIIKWLLTVLPYQLLKYI